MMIYSSVKESDNKWGRECIRVSKRIGLLEKNKKGRGSRRFHAYCSIKVLSFSRHRERKRERENHLRRTLLQDKRCERRTYASWWWRWRYPRAFYTWKRDEKLIGFARTRWKGLRQRRPDMLLSPKKKIERKKRQREREKDRSNEGRKKILKRKNKGIFFSFSFFPFFSINISSFYFLSILLLFFNIYIDLCMYPFFSKQLNLQKDELVSLNSFWGWKEVERSTRSTLKPDLFREIWFHFERDR